VRPEEKNVATREDLLDNDCGSVGGKFTEGWTDFALKDGILI
jgi:hypothetical protein